MAMAFYDMPIELEQFLEYSNYLFTFVFTIELVVKLLAFGCKEFAQDSFNLFDAFVVSASVIDIIISLVVSDPGAAAGLAALRAFR